MLVPRRSNRFYGAEEAAPESLCTASPARPARGGEEGEKRPSVAPTLPGYADTDFQGADRSAARWDAALTLRPKLQGFASVRIPTTTSTTKRGHF